MSGAVRCAEHLHDLRRRDCYNRAIAWQRHALGIPMKRSLLDATTGELKAWIEELGYPSFHANQVLHWVFQRRAEQFEGMSDLPKGLRQQLDVEWTVLDTQIVEQRKAPDGTDKLLLACRDGRRIECV